MSKIKRIYDIMLQYEERHPDQKLALSGKIGKNKWNEYTPQLFKKTANELSCALLAKGIRKGDKVAVISTNRPEWTITQMAVTQIGAVLVPIYPTITAEDYQYILQHCGAKLVILEGEIVMRKVQSVADSLTELKDIYTFVDRKDYPYWDQLIALGREKYDEAKLQELRDGNDEKECAMIIYTSGTTGTPKGVMLSHYNILSQIENLKHIPSKWSKKGLSFLPLCHAYENMIVLLYQYLGMTVYYVSNLATIAEAMREVKPTMMTAVPRVLEKFYEKIEASGKSKTGAARSIFDWAVKVALKYNIEDEDRTAVYNMQHKLADRLVYSKIRKGLGADNFDILVSGAASLKHFILPTITISLTSAAGLLRLTRASMLETVRQEYIRTAKAKGAPERRVIWKHALRNALIPVITTMGTSFGASLGGAIIAETVFAMPGMGTLLTNAIRQKDVPVVMGATLFLAVLFSVVVLVVDILYAFIDPRIKAKYQNGGRSRE